MSESAADARDSDVADARLDAVDPTLFDDYNVDHHPRSLASQSLACDILV